MDTLPNELVAKILGYVEDVDALNNIASLGGRYYWLSTPILDELKIKAHMDSSNDIIVIGSYGFANVLSCSCESDTEIMFQAAYDAYDSGDTGVFRRKIQHIPSTKVKEYVELCARLEAAEEAEEAEEAEAECEDEVDYIEVRDKFIYALLDD